MKWNKKTDILALMVGHGMQLNGVWDTGCTYKNDNEAALMLPITKYAVNILRRCGVRVITDADEKNNRNMRSSVAWANKVGARIYCSLHCDYSAASVGVAPLYRDSADKDFAVEVGKYVAKRMGMKWKGAFKRTDLLELNAPLSKVCCIFECGAIKGDLKYLKDYKKYGRAFAHAVLDYIGVPYISKKAYKIAKKAKLLAYAGVPDEAKYPTGHAKPEYKDALNEVYPNRKTWSAAPRVGASCDVFAGTCIRSSGVDKNFPRGLSSQIKYIEKSKTFTLIKGATYKDLRDGDVIIYLKKDNGGHICLFADDKIRHAALKRYWGRTTDNEKTIMSTKGKKWVKVYRVM